MGYYDGYLILSDIDGTLTRHGNDLSEENHKALTRFMAEGGYFTLATGRSPEFLPQFQEPQHRSPHLTELRITSLPKPIPALTIGTAPVPTACTRISRRRF